MTGQEFDARIVAWANTRPEVEALIQIGSRAQTNAEVDQWSDWDYHLIVRNVVPFQNEQWLSGIASYWSTHLERTERGVAKLSVVFAGGYEADFIPISSWQMKLVYWAMARPGMKFLFPKLLVRGIRNTQLIVRPGYRILIGGEAWERRLAALAVAWPADAFSREDYEFHVGGFWRHALWIAKKIARGEMRAALRWYYVELGKHRWALLEEEARAAGRAPRPEARKAEKWLDVRRLEQTAIATSIDRRVLARALLAEISLFEEVSGSVAASRGFPLRDYSAVATWLRAELGKLTDFA